MAKKNKKVELPLPVKTSSTLDTNFKYKQLEEANALFIAARELVKNTKGTELHNKALEDLDKARQFIIDTVKALETAVEQQKNNKFR